MDPLARVRRPMLSLVLLGLVAAGCSGVEFARESTAPRYKALPYTWKVAIVPRIQDVAQPAEVIGVLSLTRRGGDEERPSVEAEFQKTALRFGCDAVAAIAGETQETRSTKTVQELGVGGAKVSRQQEVVSKQTAWTGQCVRTALVPPDPTVGPRATHTPAPAVADPKPDDPNSPPPKPGDEAGIDTATARAARNVADRLLRYRDSYLRAWEDKLDTSRPEPMEVLEAMTELMFQVTGPGGFWRKTVPLQWFGCPADPSTPQCVKLDKAAEEFKQWDKVQAAIAALPRAEAGRFLMRNQKRLLDYTDTYVPIATSLSGMQATLFYQANLQ